MADHKQMTHVLVSLVPISFPMRLELLGIGIHSVHREMRALGRFPGDSPWGTLGRVTSHLLICEVRLIIVPSQRCSYYFYFRDEEFAI